MFLIFRNQKINVFHDSSMSFHDSWVGTDTPGPGEAVFAIRCIEKPMFVVKNPHFTTKNMTTTKKYKSGHSFEPRGRIWSTIDGESSYKPPGAF